jgi:hypothetical protein
MVVALNNIIQGAPMNPLITEMMIKERRNDMLQEAERLRLVALYEADNPPRKARILIALGDLLIRTGEKIKQRYCQTPEISTSTCGGF